MILQYVKDWEPFQLDALGLVSILGATAVDHSIGRLVRNRYTEFLPLLGAWTVVANQILQPLPGYCLYNVSDGIVAPDVSSWFTRWLACEDPSINMELTVEYKDTSHHWSTIPLAGFLGFTIMGTLVVIPALMGDWYGLANAVFLTLSVVIRFIIISWYRDLIDDNATSANPHTPDVSIMTPLPYMSLHLPE
jgi:hypothetical protein